MSDAAPMGNIACLGLMLLLPVYLDIAAIMNYPVRTDITLLFWIVLDRVPAILPIFASGRDMYPAFLVQQCALPVRQGNLPKASNIGREGQANR
jgi:hypothetical protein